MTGAVAIATTPTTVAAAAAAIAGRVERTPFIASPDLSVLAGCEIHLKLENLQRTGAFKLRGALARLLTLDAQERSRGVVTASAGNHGQGVAVGAAALGIPACVVLPRGVPLAKLTAIQRAGAEVVMAGSGYDEAFAAACELAAQRGAVYLHAFDDPVVIAGQGTVAREMLEDRPDLDAIVVPVGGGGLLAGTALAIAEAHANVRLVGVQAAGACAFADAVRSGSVVAGGAATIADGIAVREPAARTVAIARANGTTMRIVTDEAIARAMVLLLERHKLLAEAAGAAGVAAMLDGPAELAGKRVGIIVSGGNIDPNLLGKVLQQGLASAGRYLAFRTWLDDRPGQLHELTGILGDEHINILHVGIHRVGPYTALGQVGLDVIVDTRDAAHAQDVLALARRAGFPAEQLIDVQPER
ncbi:MAG TPA: threonine ammonia-lyase [Candidatus Limnocylindria bacterium]|nr:threonine ammonia-lyase [Candidatus Limnocylindria bacterium]